MSRVTLPVQGEITLSLDQAAVLIRDLFVSLLTSSDEAAMRQVQESMLSSLRTAWRQYPLDPRMRLAREAYDTWAEGSGAPVDWEDLTATEQSLWLRVVDVAIESLIRAHTQGSGQ